MISVTETHQFWIKNSRVQPATQIRQERTSRKSRRTKPATTNKAGFSPFQPLYRGAVLYGLKFSGRTFPISGGSIDVPRELLNDVRLSDLPQEPPVPVCPKPGFENVDHWHLQFQRASEKGIFARAKLIYMLKLIHWQEIELTKIFGAYRHAVAERRERLGDVREGQMGDVDTRSMGMIESRSSKRPIRH